MKNKKNKFLTTSIVVSLTLTFITLLVEGYFFVANIGYPKQWDLVILAVGFAAALLVWLVSSLYAYFKGKLKMVLTTAITNGIALMFMLYPLALCIIFTLLGSGTNGYTLMFTWIFGPMALASICSLVLNIKGYRKLKSQNR